MSEEVAETTTEAPTEVNVADATTESSEEAVELFGGPMEMAQEAMSLNEAFDFVKGDVNGVQEGQKEAQTEEVATEGEGKPPRMIEFKNGQSYPADTPIEVNGVEVTLGDLESSYIGQSEVQRRFTEFDKHKKQWETDVISKFKEENLGHYELMHKALKIAREGNYLESFNVLAEVNGQSPVQAKKQTVLSALKLAEQYMDKTEDEIAEEFAKEEFEYEKAQVAKKENALTEKERLKAREAAVTQRIAAHGLSVQQFSEAYQYLEKNNKLGQLEGMTEEQSTDEVCKFYMNCVKENRCHQAAEKIPHDKADTEKLVQFLYEVAHDDYSVEDIIDVYNDYKKLGTNGVSETPSKDSAPPKPAGNPERTSSSAKDYSNLEPEDGLFDVF